MGKSITVTRAEIVNRLSEGRKGNTFIGFAASTDPRLLKTGNPFKDDGIRKISEVAASVQFDYENKVNAQREREGAEADFEGQESYHEILKDAEGRLTPFAKHKKTGKLYLRVSPTSVKTRYVDNKGREVDKTAIEPYLPKRSDAGEGQGLEKAVRFNLYALDNVSRITANGQEYILTA